MQHKKCCYCEITISDEGHGKAVDHFAPKAVFKGRRNDWDNLLLACAQCNGKKSDIFPVEILNSEAGEAAVIFLTRPKPGSALLLDPSNLSVDPEAHLEFVQDDTDMRDFGLIRRRNGSRRGEYTITVIGLDRPYYTGRHRTLLIELHKDYMILLQAKHGGHDDEVARYEAIFRMRVSAKGEMAAVARAFAHKKKLDRNFNIPIPKGMAS